MKFTIYKLDLVGIHEIMWYKGNMVIIIFYYGKGNENRQLGTGFYVHHRILSAVKRLEFVSDGMLYIDLRGRWCSIIVLNVHTPSEVKNDNSKDRFYEELEQGFFLIIFLSTI